MILFSLLREMKRNVCYRCRRAITRADDLTMDHKIPWLDSDRPKHLFFRLSNVAFSHHRCNSGHARKPHRLPNKAARIAAARASSRRWYLKNK